MSKQGFTGKAFNAAHHIVAIKNIIKALMQGGWTAAALQALKHYWPQILSMALVLLLLPVIIYCCLPMMLFGFAGSSDSEVLEMTAQAGKITECFGNYDTYCQERLNKLLEDAQTYQRVGYELVQEGSFMPENWFIAIFSVSVENNLEGVNEKQIKNFINNFIICEIVNAKSDRYSSKKGTATIKCMSPEEAMEYLNYTDSDKNWANLIFNTLESEETDGNDSTYSN